MRIANLAMIAAIISTPLQASMSPGLAGAEAVRTMASDPDRFCQLSTNASIVSGNGIIVSKIATGIGEYFADSELLAEAQRLSQASKKSGLDTAALSGPRDPIDAMMERVRNDTSMQDKLEAEQRHRAEVLEQTYSAPRQSPGVSLSKTVAARFDQATNTLHCQSEATVGGALWMAITWEVGFGSPPRDAYHATSGWFVRNIETPVSTVEFAIANPDSVMVAFGDDLRLPMVKARAKVQNDGANFAEQQAAKKAEQQRAAAYANSPAARADAARRRAQEAANTRALAIEYRRLGLACQNHGGTWGFKWDETTVVPVSPGVVPNELPRMTMGCYHL